MKRLGDVLTLKRGYDLAERARKPGDIPIVSSSGITGWHDAAKVRGPGVVTGRYGTLGEVFYIPTDFWPLNTSLYVKDFKGNDPRFCVYLLISLQIGHGNVASAVPGVNRNHLHELIVRCPSLDVQRRIASILSAYDDLIEVNTRRIAILEEMTRRVFDEWFIKSAMQPLLKGWRTACLGDLVEEVRDTVLPSDVPPETPYVGLEHMPRRSTTLDAWGRADEVASTKHRFRTGDILFGKIRPYFHKVVIAPFEGVASSDAIVMRPTGSDAAAVAACLASSDAFVAHAVQTSNGTKMPRANWNVLRKYEIRLPPTDTLKRFADIVMPAHRLCSNLAFGSANLRATRDLLLPKLISGEIDLEQADRNAEAVAEAAE